ncbi:MAG TPA: tocopherol cyclase family protein [bacterium]|nr:tocopherol cyclase family protein [bacterium]
MTPAAWLVARRALLDRPWRSALLLLGYGTGVAIMIALLSVGDALLLEAQDRNLVAGGDVVVLPEGIDPAVIKVNGVTGMFLTLPNAGFLVRDVLEGPRFRSDVLAAAPQISSRLLYVRAHGRVVTASASAGIPSLDRAARAARAVKAGTDSPADNAWLNPPRASLADALDHFHSVPAAPVAETAARPPARAPVRSVWVEWDYFNVFDPATRTYAYLTLLTGAQPLGVVLARVKAPGAPVDDVLIPRAVLPGDISTTAAEQHVGPARLTAGAGGYHVTVEDPRLRVDLTIRPDGGFVLPATEVRVGAAVSGYVVPVARGRADGVIRAGGRTLAFKNAPAYHDHNWGTWTGVTWEWGQASSAAGALVYASVHLPNGEASGGGSRPTLFLWQGGRPAAAPLREAGGLVAALPVTDVTYGGWRPGPVVGGRRVRAPSEVTIRAANGADAATVWIAVADALGARPLGASAGRAAARSMPIFLQLRGEAVVRGTIDGAAISWQGPAASETFVRP